MSTNSVELRRGWKAKHSAQCAPGLCPGCDEAVDALYASLRKIVDAYDSCPNIPYLAGLHHSVGDARALLHKVEGGE